MTPRILIVGADGQGSFQVRGHQLGGAIGARVTTAPTPADWRWASAIVLVKRAVTRWGGAAKATGLPIVWDVLDAWRQPHENQSEVHAIRGHFLGIRDALGIRTLITATGLMGSDIGGVCVPHHSRPGLVPTPPRPRARVVGYDGNRRYLGRWQAALETACANHGLTFVVNPPDLSAVDVLVAFRDGKWDGPVCRRWKSGVKYVNALAAGRPILTQPSAGFADIAPDGVRLEERDAIDEALNRACSIEMRESAYENGRRRAQDYTLASVSAHYRAVLQRALERAA